MRRRPVPLLLAAVVAAGVLSGGTSAHARESRPPSPSGEITVSAASSLTEAFTALGARFERQHPEASVTFNFGSSSGLAAQIQQGAPVDVIAAADLATMEQLVSGGQVTESPTPFARNRMVIAVKPGNPQEVATVADLVDAGTVALCGATVPCGVYAAHVIEKARVAIPERRITRGTDARATLGAVAQGDADAAIVYVTDAEAVAPDVDRVEIPADQNVVAVYLVAPVADAGNRRLARAFVEFVTSPSAQRILARRGFLPA